ncbi:MAG TPA: hypothetical protein VF487_15985 [Chitinophagaceae bacterium]
MIRSYRKPGVLLAIILLLPFTLIAAGNENDFSISLNGEWQMGYARIYKKHTNVPGIATDPTQSVDSILWYKKELLLPRGDWQYATLELKGARFMPQVFVNGRMVAQQNGGMAPTFFFLNVQDIQPGVKIILEIALQPLKNVPVTDASFIPSADQWRSNVSSGLWDDVVLHLHRNIRIERTIPFIDYNNSNISLQSDLLAVGKPTGSIQFEIVDARGKKVFVKKQPITGLHNKIQFSYKNILQAWSPGHPDLYTLKVSVFDNNNRISDVQTQALGIKEFKIIDKQFYLNNLPCKIRGGTVVWHRWMRSEEGRELGYDTAWFHKNIVQRLKEHGANYLRFHLGKPPERLLDLCDKYGLLVQYEWSFFHGMPATKESLLEQYKNWLDVAMRHPSVAIIHPYNETEGDQLKTVWQALDTILKSYPPLVMEERDVLHIHKYWWSLFENVGLYYDDAAQFPQTIMVDEFGGNYLDEKGDLGGYKALKESYLRFLGRSHDAIQRLQFHAQSNSRIAEYWRRINAAGFAPFCILGSWEDGNNWFMGKLKEGKPKPVWDELTAAFSPLSISINIWDRNFTPGQKIQLPLYFFNDTKTASQLKARISITDAQQNRFYETIVTAFVPPFQKKVQEVTFVLPKNIGTYSLKAELITKPTEVKYPVVSAWDIHIYESAKPVALNGIRVGVPADEKELLSFLKNKGIASTSPADKNASIIIGSLNTWKKIAAKDESTLSMLEQAIDKGIPVILLDAGERYLGQGYPEKKNDLGPLQGVTRITDPRITNYNLFKGVSLKFIEAAEPESYLHADANDSSLWRNIPKDHTWLWNGMRGGLLAPAADMEFHGLSSAALLMQWKAKGADEKAMKEGNYYAYELQGFYEFSANPADKTIEKKLRDKVVFLVQDAPALANAINPSTPVKTTNLSQEYKDAEKGQALNFTSLATCGKNLTRVPVAIINFGTGKGKLIVSQLLTAGRLAKEFGEKDFYGIRYDEVPNQLLLNMINVALTKNE